LPNTVNYCFPPLEKLEIYNLGTTEVYPLAAQWFDYKDTHVRAISMNIQGAILLLFPGLFFVMNICFLWILVTWVRNRQRQKEALLAQALLLIALLLAANAGFSILASPIVFRYQIFPMMLSFSFSLLAAEKLKLFFSSQGD
jgi:hypothetical protein